MMSIFLLQIVLLTIIIFSVLAEIKTAGMGVAASVGLVATVSFFSLQNSIGLTSLPVVVLFFVGILFIIFELHIPGSGFFVFCGIAMIFTSLGMALGGIEESLSILAISVVISALLFVLVANRLPISRLWNKFVLKEATSNNAGYVSAKDYSNYLNQRGVAVTDLKPAGIILVDDESLDVVTKGDYINKGNSVKIIEIAGSKIVVEKVEK